MRKVPWMLVSAYLASGALAVAGHELHHKALEATFKPLTTVLLFAFFGKPSGRFQVVIAIGFFLSLVGDVALLWDDQIAFGIGLVAFLLAHVSYIVGFVSVGRPSPRVAVVAVIFGISTFILLHTLWHDPGLPRLPVTLYAVAITAMVTTAWATPGGRLVAPWPAAAGAVAFYIGDSSLSINTFHYEIPLASLLTMGVYWLGQLGIALAARAGTKPGTKPETKPGAA